MNTSFPHGFFWGAATSSHQVEGGNTNDWTGWEKGNANRLAREALSKFGHLSGWTEKFGKEAARPENYISGIACDHYRRYEEDFDIAKELGHTAHRFSLEWSRIEPQEGVFDAKEITHYHHVVRALRYRNLEPFVTLWHWTLPSWLAQKGGVLAAEFPHCFARYTEKISSALGDDVRFWITLNEPDILTGHVYRKAVWPPQEKSLRKYLYANLILIDAHKKSYAVIKKNFPNANVGIAKHQISFELARNTVTNRILKTSAHFLWNRWFLDRIDDSQDFIGLNHYNRNVIDNGFLKNPRNQLTDLGWEFSPESIRQALLELTPYQKPIYITENGLADQDDTLREAFLTTSLRSVREAIEGGADVRGYLYWSLLDNFEWDKGFWPRFGMIDVNRRTLARNIRPSAHYFAKLCRENGATVS
ncbi:MAG: family 1 glycosylhydrolase [Candidatus Moraniibacteriota bacterium]|nr:MAG: family 1 glycosylhydrolase [Candidatus Moranbacteria bacterium]